MTARRNHASQRVHEALRVGLGRCTRGGCRDLSQKQRLGHTRSLRACFGHEVQTALFGLHRPDVRNVEHTAEGVRSEALEALAATRHDLADSIVDDVDDLERKLGIVGADRDTGSSNHFGVQEDVGR